MKYSEIRRKLYLMSIGKKTYIFNFICLITTSTLFLLNAIPFWLLVLVGIYCGNKMVERATR